MTHAKIKVLLVSDRFPPFAHVVTCLEREEHVILGPCSTATAHNHMATSHDLPDVVLIFTDRGFEAGLELTRAVTSIRYSNNYSPRPQVLCVTLNETLLDLQPIFSRAGGRLFVLRSLDQLKDELHAARLLIAQIAVPLAHFRIIHARRQAAPRDHCIGGETVEALQFIAPLRPPVDVPASLALRTFIAAAIEMNGRFRNKNEFNQDLRFSAVYRGSRAVTVPSASTIKTYLLERAPEAFQRAIDEWRIGIDAHRLVEKEMRVGNEVGYRFRVSREVFHIEKAA